MATGQVVTNGGINIMLGRAFGEANQNYSAITQFDAGTDDTTPTETDTALGSALGITKDNNATVIDTGAREIVIQSILAFNEGNGNLIKEWGLFNTDSSAIMGVHVVFTITGQSKTASEQLVFLTKVKRAST